MDHADSARPVPAATRLAIDTLNGAFLVGAAGSTELSREAARAPRYLAPARGVRWPAGSTQPSLDRRSAAVLGSGRDAVLADVSAAAAWGFPLPPWIGLHEADQPVTVAAPTGLRANRPRRGDVRGRRLRIPKEHATHLFDLQITTPARTWLDCAELIPREHLVAMGDVALRRGLASPGELARMVAWARRRRGVVNARACLPLLDPDSESPGESITRAHLLFGELPRPVCNLDICFQGRWIARVDLAWPTQRVIVEYDGVVHLSETQRRRDAARRNLLQEAGWLVITFTADDLARPWLMVSQVRRALQLRTTR
jgi:hypothetical protein